MASVVDFRLAGGAQPLILVPARVNGAASVPFVLDTGAAVCLLSPRLALRAGVAVTARRPGVGAGGPVEVGIGRADTIAVGTAAARNVPAAVTDELERIGKVVGARIAGGLGYGFLRNFRMTIDYRRNRLELAGKKEAGTAPGSAIRFQLADARKPLVLVPARVNGEGPFRFALDTGASTTVVSRSLARELGIEGSRASVMVGGGGRVAGLFGAKASLEVGAAASGNLDVIVGPFLEPLSEAVGVTLDGIVGYNFLRQYRVTLDYPGSILALENP